MKESDYTTDYSPSLGIMDYLRVIRERWLLGTACGIFVAGIFSLYMLSRVPEYTSSLELLVDVSQDNVVDIEQVVDEAEIARSSRAESLLKHHLIEMQSRKFSDFVISSLDGREISQILDPYRSKELLEPDLRKLLNDTVTISLNSKDMLYVISCTHRDPEVAARLANRYASKYVEYVLSDVGSSNASALQFLRQNASSLRQSIQENRQKLQRFREELGIISIADSRGIAIDKIVDLNAKRINLLVEKQGFETILSQLESREIEAENITRGKIVSGLEIAEIGAFGNVNAIKTELDQALSRKKEIELVFLRRHPVFIENQARIRDLEMRLLNEISLAINSFLTSIEKLDAQIALNHAHVSDLEKEAQRLDEMDITYHGMESKIVQDQATLKRIEERLNETIISSQLSKANMRVVDEALVAIYPSYPDRKRTVMGAFFLFFLGFVGLPVAMNLIDDKLKTPWDVEEYIGKALLGDIINLKKDFKGNVHELVWKGNDSMTVDSFRGIYNSIKLNTYDVDRKVQVVTSTIPDEGKTMFSLNYSVVSMQHGNRVLLVDCDLRKPQIQKVLGMESKTGLVSWFNDGAKFVDSYADFYASLGIEEMDSGVFLLPAGKATNRSTELVESKVFADLIDRLSGEFDHIIIDTPPLGVFPDAMFLAEHAQEIIYVTRYNKVSRNAVKHFVAQLDRTSASVCGIVLNGRDSKRMKNNFYGYNYGYNYSYAAKYYKKHYASVEIDEESERDQGIG